MKRYTFLLTLLILFLCCNNINSQGSRFYSAGNGLSCSLINQIFQDRYGYIWIATEYGLNKFDGTKFTIYKHAAADSSTLKNNYVRSLYEDRDNLLVGCYNGLMKFNRATNSFNEIPMIRDGEQKIPFVSQIIKLHNGDIWAITAGQGIFIVDKDLKSAHYMTDLMKHLNFHFYNSVYQDSKGIIWLGTEFNGIVKYNLKSRKVKVYRAPEIPENSINSIIEDKKGNIFVGLAKHGVIKYDDGADTFKSVEYSQKKMTFPVFSMVTVHDEVIVGTDGYGLKRYNYSTGKLDDYNANLNVYDYSKGKIHAMMVDKDNNLWVGLFQKGIMYITQKEKKFGYYGINSSTYNIIGSNCVRAIYKDIQNNLWIGTEGEGLYKINEKGKLLHHYSPDGTENSLPSNISAIYQDSRGVLWIGSSTSGTWIIDPKTDRYVKADFSDSEQVNSFIEKNGKMYVGTFGSGIYVCTLDGKKQKVYIGSIADNNSLPNNWILSLYLDSKDMLWICHRKGVSCMNIKNDNFINYGKSSLVIEGCIGYSITEDRNGDILAGTSEGLFKFNKGTSQLTQYTVADGLPHNVICGICEDAENNLWLSTYMGICKFNTSTKYCMNYYERDGIQGNEFYQGAYMKDNAGRIYFGGINGMTYFNPNEIHDVQQKNRVLITDFYVNQTPVNINSLSGNDKIIECDVMKADIFRLNYTDNTFSISFSTLQYDNPEQIIYQYRISELSNTWHTSEPGKNSVTYNNLPPGKYTFQVKVMNSSYGDEIRTIQIIISPPWYFSWWAYCIYIFIVLLQIKGIIDYLKMKMRHKHEMLMRKNEEQLNDAKMQFFINISHEIRTPMTLITSPLEKLISEARDKNLRESYVLIYRNAQRILRLINQLMDVRKLDKGQMFMKFRKADMVDFIDDIMLTFEYTARKKNIEFTFEHQDSHLEVWIDINNFDKIIMNLLSNAFKYTPVNGHINIRLITGYDTSETASIRNYFQIEVIDSGIGIDSDKTEKIFQRFYQIDNEITGHNFGTGIGLHLTKSLVELHHGIIKAERVEEGNGSRFTVRIPLGCSHLRTDELEMDDIINVEDIVATSERMKQIDIALYEDAEEERKSRSKTNFKIVIVEDDDDISDYLRKELSDDYKITLCTNGKEGYDTIIEMSPDLIVSDVMMPIMDGITLTKKIRQNVDINHIPIILLTAKSAIEDKVEGMEVGADAYFAKPFNIDILKSTVANLILNRRLLRTKFTGAQNQEDKIQQVILKPADEKLMEKIMKVVNENIDNTELNVEMIADNVGFSRVHVHRKLKELTNMSARDFIKNIRLNQAAKLLKESNVNVSEVAYATGFLTLSHFSTSFKERYGITPSEYAKKECGTF